jgi:hypothetical protein
LVWPQKSKLRRAIQLGESLVLLDF